MINSWSAARERNLIVTEKRHEALINLGSGWQRRRAFHFQLPISPFHSRSGTQRRLTFAWTCCDLHAPRDQRQRPRGQNPRPGARKTQSLLRAGCKRKENRLHLLFGGGGSCAHCWHWSQQCALRGDGGWGEFGAERERSIGWGGACFCNPPSERTGVSRSAGSARDGSVRVVAPTTAAAPDAAPVRPRLDEILSCHSSTVIGLLMRWDITSLQPPLHASDSISSSRRRSTATASASAPGGSITRSALGGEGPRLGGVSAAKESARPRPPSCFARGRIDPRNPRRRHLGRPRAPGTVPPPLHLFFWLRHILAFFCVFFNPIVLYWGLFQVCTRTAYNLLIRAAHSQYLLV